MTRLVEARLSGVLVLCVFLLSGCGLLGLQIPETISQRLAYAYATHTAVLLAADQALERGEITVEDAESLLANADEARVWLDLAAALLEAGDAAGADRRLVLGRAVLTELQAYLREGRR